VSMGAKVERKPCQLFFTPHSKETKTKTSA
jgi:hypothetical protein